MVRARRPAWQLVHARRHAWRMRAFAPAAAQGMRHIATPGSASPALPTASRRDKFSFHLFCLLRLAFLLLLLLLVLIVPALLLLGELLHELQHLPHELLGDDLHDLVLLQLLPGDVQRQVVGIHDAPDEVQIAGQEVLELLGHQDAANEELDLRLLRPIVVHHVEGRLFGQEKDGLELDLALRVEVRVGQRVKVVLGDAFVELGVLLLRDILLRAQPNGLLRVHLLPLIHSLLLGRLLLLLLLLVVVLCLDVILLLLVLVLLLVIILVLLLGLCLHLLLHLHVDGKLDELRILLSCLLELVFGEVVVCVLLKMQRHTRAAAQCVAARVIDHREGGIGAGFPDVLHRVVVALGSHRDLVRNQKGGVKTNAELAYEVRISALGHGLQEVRGAGLGHSPQIVDEVGFGHANACVGDGERLGFGVVLQLHLQVLGIPQIGLILHTVEARLLQGIRGVRDELAQEDLLVCVERVDDDVHEAADLCLELMLL
mmetsp:Transcript_24199/g.66542  ORF Transcript_24199/g.66542 Transcript_24199/m.66542 type:complete len:486 (+) Transcript_24199:1301-2758(+)